jgi:hypothetical protein
MRGLASPEVGEPIGIYKMVIWCIEGLGWATVHSAGEGLADV